MAKMALLRKELLADAGKALPPPAAGKENSFCWLRILYFIEPLLSYKHAAINTNTNKYRRVCGVCVFWVCLRSAWTVGKVGEAK